MRAVTFAQSPNKHRQNKAMHAEHAIGRFSHGGFTRACRVMAQGLRTLSSLQSKDLRQIVFVPTGHSASPDDAVFALDLLQQAQCELFQPG